MFALRLYPADAAAEPVVSNLNWKAGDSATANKVDVKLSSTGAVDLAVSNGTVNVIGDVVGYYTTTSLMALQGAIDALNDAQPFTVSNVVSPVTFTNLTETSSPVVTVSVTAPVAGQVTVHSTAAVKHFEQGKGVYCGIGLAADPLPAADNGFRQAWGQPTGWNGPGEPRWVQNVRHRCGRKGRPCACVCRGVREHRQRWSCLSTKPDGHVHAGPVTNSQSIVRPRCRAIGRVTRRFVSTHYSAADHCEDTDTNHERNHHDAERPPIAARARVAAGP